MLIKRISLNHRMISPTVLNEVEKLVSELKKSLFLCENWYKTKSGVKCDVLVYDSESEAKSSSESTKIKNEYLYNSIHNDLQTLRIFLNK